VSSIRILRSGDCHPNPGPVYKFPCGVCQKPCKTNQKCIACDTCDTWYHTKCMQMPDPVFEGCKNVTWICFSCGIPNFSTTLFETHLADSVATSLATENSYSILSDVPGKQTTSPSLGSLLSPNSYSSVSLDNSIGSPQHTSSQLKTSQIQPHRPDQRKNTMRFLTVNFQSLRAKRSTF
jgi:hypothetical protein